MKKLVLIDGNSLLNRAFYATTLFTTKAGFPTNGILGFTKLLLNIVADKKPEYMIVTFDVHAPTFRKEMCDSYKANRKGMPEELAMQMPVLKNLLNAMRIRIVEKAGYEADDLIGTLSASFPVHSYIYTGDRDSYQLVGQNATVCFTRKGVSDILELTSENFSEETNLADPSKVIDLKALMGDKSDNIPGVPGIGEKTAYSLLEQFGDLDGIYAHLSELKGATVRKLEEGKESAYLSKTLATIVRNVPLEVDLEDCRVFTPFPAAARSILAELEMKTLLALPVFAQEEESAAPAEAEKPQRITRILQGNVEEAYELYRQCNAVAVYFGKSLDFSFSFPDTADRAEMHFPIRENLIDPGFDMETLFPLLQTIVGGNKTVYFYDSKKFRHFLSENGVEMTCPLEDLSLLKYIADYSDREESLPFLTEYYNLPKDTLADNIFALFYALQSRMPEAEERLYREVELPLSSILYGMEQTGVLVDMPVLEELGKKYEAEIAELTERIRTIAGEKFNVRSPQQLGVILFEKLKLQYPGKAKNGKYSTAQDVLEKVEDFTGIVPLILRHRQLSKLSSTYIDGLKNLISPDGRVHTTYNQSVTSTGRLSSANPNMQNIPVRDEEGRELRKLFVAPEGHVFVDADYSQIELRLLAHFSECPELVQAFRRGEDIHASTAASVFGVELDEVTPAMRRMAKAVNFGIIYGISEYGLSENLKIPVKEAKAYIDHYFQLYPAVKNYMNANVDFAKANGYATSLLGRKRVITDLKSSNYMVRMRGEREAMNMPLQGTSADIIKIAMIRVQERLQKEGLSSAIVLQVHDELILDCPVEEAEKAKALLCEEMENAVTLSVPLTVSATMAKNWYEAK